MGRWGQTRTYGYGYGARRPKEHAAPSPIDTNTTVARVFRWNNTYKIALVPLPFFFGLEGTGGRIVLLFWVSCDDQVRSLLVTIERAAGIDLPTAAISNQMLQHIEISV